MCFLPKEVTLSHVELRFSPKRNSNVLFVTFFPRCGQICASCSCTRSRPPWTATTSSPCGSSALQKGSKPTLAHRLLLIIDNQWNLAWPRQIKDSQSKATKCICSSCELSLELNFWRSSKMKIKSNQLHASKWSLAQQSKQDQFYLEIVFNC